MILLLCQIRSKEIYRISDYTIVHGARLADFMIYRVYLTPYFAHSTAELTGHRLSSIRTVYTTFRILRD